MSKLRTPKPLATATALDNARRHRRPVAAGALVPRLLDAPTRRAGFTDARLVADWAEVVGAELAAVSVPLRIDRRSRCLTLLVRPVAALLVQHDEPRILERINIFFGREVVRRLHLVQGPLPSPPPPPAPATPDPATAADVAAAVAAVEPAELRAALTRLGLAIAGRRQQS